MDIIKKISLAAKNQKTYRVGLLQTKAYRILNQKTTELLSKYQISSTEWAMLGLLFDSKDGMRLIHAADALGVEAPFVTQMIAHLKKYDLVVQAADAADSRAKVARLTDKGRAFVEETEIYVRKEMKSLLKGASIRDILGYLAVLQKITENSGGE
jgi:DNA-binding MarR family transcriptional regulator